MLAPLRHAAARIRFTQIYRAEALAVSWMLEQPIPEKLLLRVDNEALVNAIKKGRSNIPEANYVCKQLFQLRRGGTICTAKHIRTHLNPADAPSRMKLGPRVFLVSPQFA